MPSANEPRLIHRYFVDEAGDPVLFNGKGKVIIGTEGCSRAFMLGVAHIADPVGLGESLESLRAELLVDPYFRGVPSLDPARGKTALFFHAKNAPAEVRREVFKVLARFEIKVQGLVRRKAAILEACRERQKREPSYRYQPNDIYDECVTTLFSHMLHAADENQIVFARRGKAERIAALGAAIEAAKAKFEQRHAKGVDRPTDVRAAYPSAELGLQAMDYYLWALQRLYERGEERFFELLRPDFKLIVDRDDTRRKQRGEYYNKRNPLDAAKIKTP